MSTPHTKHPPPPHPLGRNSQKSAQSRKCFSASHHILLPRSSILSFWGLAFRGLALGRVFGGQALGTRFGASALEHSKICTLCDFGHLQFFI
jgi:hypothetical protein